MSGVVHLREENSWIVSSGTYDQIIDRLETVLRYSGETDLGEKVTAARPPYLRYLTLEHFDPADFLKMQKALDDVYEGLLRQGPDGYGGTPQVFDAVVGHVTSLKRLMSEDPRSAPV